ncbi:MAG: zinc ribbon domain-containing protein [Bacteroidota bacterium]
MPDSRECPSCALPAPADAEVCPYCDYEFPSRPRSLGVGVALMVLLLLLWLVGSLFL